MASKRPHDHDDDSTPDNVELKWRRMVVGEAEIRLMSQKPNSDRVVVHTPVALHGGIHIQVDPPPAIVFHSFDELTDALGAYFEATQQEFSIRNSITVEHANETAARSVRFPENDVRFKYSSMTYVCKHGRTQKRRNNPDLAKTKKVKFAYSGCQACLWINLVLLGPPGARRWVYHVHKMVHVHNHELSVENSVASLRPFRAYLDLIYNMKHAGASPQDMLTMLATREPSTSLDLYQNRSCFFVLAKKITIQTVRNILRNYAAELAAPTPPPRLRPHQVPRLLHASSSTNPFPALPSAFHPLFSSLVKASIEQPHVPGYSMASRFFYLNLCSIQSILQRSWQVVQSNATQQSPLPPPSDSAEKTFHATILTTVAADGTSPMPPFCVFPTPPASGGSRLHQVGPNVVMTDRGLATPDAMECAILYFHATLPPRLPRPVVLVVEHASPSPSLLQLCTRYGEFFGYIHDVVQPIRSCLLTPFESQLCHQLGLVLPHLATTAAIVSDLPPIVAHTYQTCVAQVGSAAIADAFRESGLHPPNLPQLAAGTPVMPLPKATIVVQEHRTATISVQSNAMPRFAIERRA
ncbi:hypothetical protein B5M09_005333 [Aphanomyces astaci]|uniref:ZSWIM3 N-terminal domain-containing protein n=1 Tax=Aphanomyces astaci TaxID=112090 RepID=A0A3R8CML0_APHAT|nr:hypothetical protein B5M09_005333 [Aphanomyces astaci]